MNLEWEKYNYLSIILLTSSLYQGICLELRPKLNIILFCLIFSSYYYTIIFIITNKFCYISFSCHTMASNIHFSKSIYLILFPEIRSTPAMSIFCSLHLQSQLQQTQIEKSYPSFTTSPNNLCILQAFFEHQCNLGSIL